MQTGFILLVLMTTLCCFGIQVGRVSMEMGKIQGWLRAEHSSSSLCIIYTGMVRLMAEEEGSNFFPESNPTSDKDLPLPYKGRGEGAHTHKGVSDT